ncbi:MAG: alpha/beta fold hydrolase [Bacteroidetes bacterium]|nr:MAG: alpha/beta fold hydrolase [Bacteroidota bacterium]
MDLNCKTFGQGPALIILHGLFGSLDNWVTHARKLAESYSVYLVDQRNHGKSPHAEEWDYDVMAEDLYEFMDQRGIVQAHLLGHSMGGKTVMRFAGEYPERVDKLLVIDMAPKHYKPHHTAILKALTALDLKQIGSRQEADAILAKDIPQASVRQFLLKGLGRDEQGGYRWKFNLEVINRKYEEVLKNVAIDFPFEKPSLFLYGEASPYMDPADFGLIRELFPQAEFVGLPGVGHWIHAEAPEDFLREVHRFLAG